jgi:hypothetical protein
MSWKLQIAQTLFALSGPGFFKENNQQPPYQ